MGMSNGNVARINGRMDVNEGMKGMEQNHLSIGCHGKVIRERKMDLHPESQICRKRGINQYEHSAN